MTKLVEILRERPAAVSGLMLLTATVAALVWANSSASGSYHALWATEFRIGIGGAQLAKPVILWVNDALMAVFFLLVGLEIKREIFEGALSTVRSAALPIAAAVGGVLLPAAIYLIINQQSGGDSDGWAVPAATDIAFALGILALLGSRVPLSLKVFLTTVAVVDDLAAVVIIAAFFTASIDWTMMALAGGAIVALAALNIGGVSRALPYAVVGILLWLAVLKSGLHATLAGVVLAAFIPIRPEVPKDGLLERLVALVKRLQNESAGGLAPDSAIDRVRYECNLSEAPVVRWEHAIQPFVLFFVVPVFALANAGVTLGGGESSGMGVVGLGVALGLFIGKPLGITMFAWLAVRTRAAELPPGLSWSVLHAGAWLGGIGFTMSMFIAGLAMTGPSQEAARLGLLVGSGLAAVVGSVLVWRSCRPQESAAPAQEPNAAAA